MKPPHGQADAKMMRSTFLTFYEMRSTFLNFIAPGDSLHQIIRNTSSNCSGDNSLEVDIFLGPSSESQVKTYRYINYNILQTGV